MAWANQRRTVPLGEKCEACGFVHTRCAGHAKHTNPERRAAAEAKWGTKGPFPCMKRSPEGSEVCDRHGASAPQVKEAAEQRVETTRILGRMGQLMVEAGGEVDDLQDHEALLLTIRKVRRMVWALTWMVEELDEPTEVDRYDVKFEHPVVTMHLKYTTLLGHMEESALKLGLAVRRQQFREGQVARIGEMVRALVTGLGRSLDEPEVVPVVEQVLALLADSDEAA